MTKRFLSLTAVAAAAALAAATPAAAGPGWPVTKPPVVGGLTGPPIDPAAALGQWFTDLTGRVPTVRPYEFYDNAQGFGGGAAGTDAIRGFVLGFTVNGAGDVTGFTVRASITNDLASVAGPALGGANSHGETLAPQLTVPRDMGAVKLATEFADDGVRGNFDPGAPGNSGPEANIYAIGYDQLAWFSFTGTGAFQVPTWDFGNIRLGETVTRDLLFGLYTPVPLAGLLPLFDARDIFSNRTTSLKISNYFDTLEIDDGTPYPVPPGFSSDVGVFYAAPEPASVGLAGVAAVAAGVRAARRRRG